MKPKVLLIIYSEARKGSILKKVEEIEKNLIENGFEVDTRYTKKDNNAENIIEKYTKKVDVIMTCGGDGTLHEVVNAVIKKGLDVSISFLPFGTTNDFSRTIGIPIKSLELSKGLKDGEIVKCDIGKLGNSYFYYIAAFGIFTKVSYSTKTKLKKKWGKFAYYYEGLKEIKNRKPYHAKITIDGQVLEDDYIYCSITNSVSIGGFKWFKKSEVQIDDGKFEVLLFKYPKNLLELIKLLWKILWKNYKSENIYFTRTNNLLVEAEDQMSWTLDGEYGGEFTKVSLETIKNQIKLVTINKKERGN